MKIAYIVPSLAQAGNVCVVKDLATVMCQNNHQCVIYYFDDSPSGYEFPCETIRISIKDRIAFDNFDIVHTHALRPDIFAFFHFPYKSKTHLICTIHNYVFEDSIDYKGRFIGVIVAIIWQLLRMRNERFLVLSNAHYNYYKRWFNKNKISVAYNTRVLDKTIDIPQEDKDFFSQLRTHYDVICSSICQITDRKGLDQIIDAMPFVDKNICYVIIGDGPKCQKLKDKVSRLGLVDRVFFMGKRSEGYRYLPYIDIFCIPSHSEGFPLAMLEAASYGKAMVSSDLAVFKEVFTDNECVICKENDVKSFANGIQYAIRNMDILGHNAQKKFESSYSPSIFYEKHYNIYKELLSK